MLEQLVSYLLTFVVIIAVFYWFGGGELIRVIKNKRLKKQIRSPFEEQTQQAITSIKNDNIQSLSTLDVMLVSEALKGDETWPTALYNDNPDNSIAVLLYGDYLIKKGWLARGGGSAASVSLDNARLFFDCLNQAVEVLQTLLNKQDPFEAQAVASLLLAYKGMSAGEEAEAALYEQYAVLYPENMSLHLTRLGQLTRRWGGSAEQMFDFSRQLSQQGGIMSAVLAASWVEHGVDEDVKTMKKAISKSNDKQALVAAYNTLPALPESLATRDDYFLVLAYNIYAAYFYDVGDNKKAKDALSKTSGYCTPYPWIFKHIDYETAFYNAVKECKVSRF